MKEPGDTLPRLQRRPEQPFDVVGMGLNAVDWICLLPHFPQHNSKLRLEGFQRRGGGPTATAMAVCARYGLRTRYVGRVGDDEVGEFCLRDLARESMDLQIDRVEGASTQIAVILVDRPSGERTVLWQRDPKLLYRKGELSPHLIQCASLLHMDGHDLEASLQAARWAREVGMRISLDLDEAPSGIEELLRLSDFPIPSLDFYQRWLGHGDWSRGLAEVASLSGGFAGVTLGRAGAAVWWRDEMLQVPSLPVRAVDTTGAGDVFHGAFAYALFQDWPLLRSLRFANIAAALSCTAVGARGGIPPLSLVRDYLNRWEQEGKVPGLP